MKKRSIIESVFFDLDGTIIDSETLAFQAIMHCFKNLGKNLNPKDAQIVAGRKWEIVVDFLLQHYPVKQTRQVVTRLVFEEYRKLQEKELKTVPGSLEAIRSMAGQYSLGLVSGSTRNQVIWALDRFSVKKFFKVILGAEDYLNSKPAPDGYLKAIKIMGVLAEHVLVFEDSEPGIQAALLAGTQVVAVTCTNHYAHNLSQAHRRIKDFTGIGAEWVRSWAQK